VISELLALLVVHELVAVALLELRQLLLGGWVRGCARIGGGHEDCPFVVRVPGSADSCGAVSVCAPMLPLMVTLCKHYGIIPGTKIQRERMVLYRMLTEVLYIGDKLRDLRKRALMSQRELARRSGVGVTTIVRIERNQVEPQGATIRKLALALEVDPAELVGD
jgi:DNA-binding XRE family transcriptional regulator